MGANDLIDCFVAASDGTYPTDADQATSLDDGSGEFVTLADVDTVSFSKAVTLTLACGQESPSNSDKVAAYYAHFTALPVAAIK